MKKILLIDDDMMFRIVMVEWLRVEGFDAIAAADGIEGIQLAQAHRPDAIFCDVNMPVLNGIEVFNQVRSNSSINHIPFFFVTSEPERTRGLKQLGATGVISKGAETYQFRQALTTLKNDP